MLHKAWYSWELHVTVPPRTLSLGYLGIIHLFLYIGAWGPIWGSLRHLPRHTMQTPTPWYLPLLPQLYQCTPFSYSPVLPEGFLYPLLLGLCLGSGTTSQRLPSLWRLYTTLHWPASFPLPVGLHQSLCLLDTHPYKSLAHARTRDFETEKNWFLCFLPSCYVIPFL